VGGEATLSGTVGNAHQKQRAADECWKTSNVTDVINNLKVNWLHDRGERVDGPNPTDAELQKNVIAELQHEPRVDSSNVFVGAVGGHVTLRGTVPSYYQRQIAEQDVRSVIGTVWLSNLLEVRTAVRPDIDILRDVNFAISTDYVLRNQGIQTRVVNGLVELSGSVVDDFSVTHAAVVAGRVFGVRSVSNQLKVPQTRVFRDAAITERVQARLASNWETRWVAKKISVSVRNGVVTLTGEVDRWAERREAERVASITDGVITVENRLSVRGSSYQWEQWYNDRSNALPGTRYPGDGWYLFEVPFSTVR
jgi:osmotically-inducible protein OsmY